MNPFLEPTVATPTPEERRQWSTLGPKSAAQRACESTLPRAPRAPAQGHAGECKGRGRDKATGAIRRISVVAGALLLAGSLFVPGAAAAVDVNAATMQQLQEVKGIGPKMARSIIDERERGGRFDSITDLSERVKGIGPKKAASMQASGLSVGADTPKKSPTASPARRRP